MYRQNELIRIVILLIEVQRCLLLDCGCVKLREAERVGGTVAPL
jgi:hypothetical protein